MSLDVSDCLFSYPALCDCLQDLERSIRYDPASFGLRSGTPMVLSLGFAVDAIDPLQVLRAWVDPEVCHFYFEQSGQAVLAIGEALSLTVEGTTRFEQARDWVTQVTQRVVVRGDRISPFVGPHFFCGFSFFDHSEDGFAAGSIFLPRWQIARLGDRSSIVVNRVVDDQFCGMTIAAEIWKALQQIQASAGAFEADAGPSPEFIEQSPPRQPKVHPLPQQERKFQTLNHQTFNHEPLNHQTLNDQTLQQPESTLKSTLKSLQAFTSPDQFKTAVYRALETIESRQIKKIVLALSYEVKASDNFDVVTSLHNLRDLYPGCYIFACNNDRGETFLGASPERLVTVVDRRLETDALAGSAPRGETPEADLYLAQQLLMSEKDIHEHQLVIDFITRKLLDLGLNPEMLSATLLQLPNIQHLHTPIHAVIPRSVHILDLVAALHPTPAVAGVPTDVACTQIKQLESFDRSRYAAPIGWIDGQGNGEFAVGIRSAILAGDRARLFAGAGIVRGSNPEKELAEVQLKLQALLRAIG